MAREILYINCCITTLLFTVIYVLNDGVFCRNIDHIIQRKLHKQDTFSKREIDTGYKIRHKKGSTDYKENSNYANHHERDDGDKITKLSNKNDNFRNIKQSRPRVSETRSYGLSHKTRHHNLHGHYKQRGSNKRDKTSQNQKEHTKARQRELSPNFLNVKLRDGRKGQRQMYRISSQRWHSSNIQSAPPGVARLEQRLHPSAANSIKNLKEQLSVVLQKIKRKVNEVNYEYMSMSNNTRKDVMLIRDELQKISHDNDMAYDSVLDTSQLVRYVMLRAHQHGLIGPPTQSMVRAPSLSTRNFGQSLYDARLQERDAKYLMSRVMNIKQQCVQQDAQSESVKTSIDGRLPFTELEDLYVISQRVLSKIDGIIKNSLTKRKLDRYQAMQDNIKQNMQDAENMSRTAYLDVKYSKGLLKDNKILRDRILAESQSKTRTRRATETHSDVEELVRRMKEKSRDLQLEADFIESTFKPLLITANRIPTDGAHTLLMGEIQVIVRRMESFIMKMNRKMDEIRIYLGDENILRERCEDLIEGSGDDDETPIDCDQFRIESGSGELEIFSTEKPIFTSSTPPPVIEGSGDVDSDFVFVNASDRAGEEKEEEEGGSWYTGWLDDDPNIRLQYTFRDKLKEKVSMYLGKSEEIYKMSEKQRDRLTGLVQRSDDLGGRKAYLQGYVKNASILMRNWTELKSSFNSSKHATLVFDANFFTRLEEIQNRSKDASSRVNEIVEKVTKANQNKDSEKVTAEARSFSDLISTVSLLKANSQKLKSIKDISRTSCESVQRSATKLRNNIAELRQKIVRARQITQSMPISVALDGSNSFLVSVSPQKRYESPTTSFGLCIKPSGDSMPVASFHGNASVSYTIDIIDRKPRVMVEDSDGENIDTLKSNFPLTSDKWYNLKLKRYGHILELETQDRENQSNVIKEMTTMLDVKPLQQTPSYVTVGSGVPGSKENYRGCIGQIMIDGKFTALMIKDNAGMKPQRCGKQCSGASMIFEGDGYAKFSLDIVYPSYKVENIALGFRTLQKDGVLFLLNDRLQSLQVLISLTNGSLHVEARTRRGTTVVKSSLKSYSNGSLHTVQIDLGTTEVEVKVDSSDDTFNQETTTQEITPSIDDGIFLGGLGAKTPLVTGKNKLRSIVGCISKFEISNQDIPLFMMKESRNVHLGDCQQNIWIECVRFSDNSTPIVFPKSKDTKRIYVAVERNSMGRLLHYLGKNKFEIEILVNGNGIEISDIKNDESTELESSYSHDEDWYMIAIENDEDDKQVVITFNGTSTVIPHSSGGWFVGQTEKEYTLTIGGSKFHGGVSRLLVNDKYIPMSAYRKDNNLGSCEKRTSDFVDSKDIDEKPVC